LGVSTPWRISCNGFSRERSKTICKSGRIINITKKAKGILTAKGIKETDANGWPIGFFEKTFGSIPDLPERES